MNIPPLCCVNIKINSLPTRRARIVSISSLLVLSCLPKIWRWTLASIATRVKWYIINEHDNYRCMNKYVIVTICLHFNRVDSDLLMVKLMCLTQLIL